MLDEHFEKFIEAEYDDEEIGSCDDEEVRVKPECGRRCVEMYGARKPWWATKAL